MKDYARMSPLELQMEVMDQVTNMLEAIREARHEAIIPIVTTYSMALQQLTNLATKNER